MQFSTVKRRAVAAVIAYFQRGWTLERFMNFDNVSPYIHLHLLHFYLSLMCALASSALGSYLNLVLNIGGSVTLIGFVGSIACLCYLPSWKQKKRVCLLMAAAFFEGASIGLLIESKFNQAIIASAVMELAMPSACFLAGAMLTDERDYIYSAGLLTTCVLVLLKILIASAMYDGYPPLWTLKVCTVIVWYASYIMLYSQELVERARSGDLDYVKAVLAFFTDFAGLFAHVVFLWLKKRFGREQRRRRN